MKKNQRNTMEFKTEKQQRKIQENQKSLIKLYFVNKH